MSGSERVLLLLRLLPTHGRSKHGQRRRTCCVRPGGKDVCACTMLHGVIRTFILLVLPAFPFPAFLRVALTLSSTATTPTRKLSHCCRQSGLESPVGDSVGDSHPRPCCKTKTHFNMTATFNEIGTCTSTTFFSVAMHGYQVHKQGAGRKTAQSILSVMSRSHVSLASVASSPLSCSYRNHGSSSKTQKCSMVS